MLTLSDLTTSFFLVAVTALSTPISLPNFSP